MMKVFILILSFTLTNAEPCQPKLLESFDMDGTLQTMTYGNMICNTVSQNLNCCSYLNQLKIYQNWAVHKERKNILKFYNEFHKSFKEMFATFKKIEEQSLTIIKHTNDNQAGSNCYKIASAVSEFKHSSMEDLVLGKLTKSFNFLYNSRKGFYCSLCDSSAHQFYDKVT